MKIVQINAVCGKGSTGKICVDISKLLTENNIENYILYASGESDYPLGIKYANDKNIKLQALKARIFGNYGFNSKKMTKKLISKLDEISPDIIHLHNLHGHNVNLEMLFEYFNENPQIKIFWTFHDFWAFTGYCPYFETCEKWQDGCASCVQRKRYSFIFDKSAKLYNSKKELFTKTNFTITTPSQYVEKITKKSFLKNCDIVVVKNAIDLNVFKPIESDFREKYNLENKKIILGVSVEWGHRKGLDVFVELSKRLPDNYQIVLVGTNDNIDAELPSNIISIHRTANQTELAEIYTQADVFANPTRDETFGLVNVEALACGTPVVTFRTGGSPECIDESCGIVVDCNDVDSFEKEILNVCENHLFTQEACMLHARNFDKNEKYKEYLNLYLR